MGDVLYVFELRKAVFDRRASIEAYGNALRANAPAGVLTQLQRWCRATDRRLRHLERPRSRRR